MEPGKQIERWADTAMYPAEPDPAAERGEKVRPRVTLISMTDDPLLVMAAASDLYAGHVVRDPKDIPRHVAENWFADMTRTKLQAPLEFVDLHFLIEGVTRAFTHQLVRQRTAVFVQESQRFAVKENAEFEVALPPSLANTKGGQAPGAETSTREWQRNIWDDAVRHIAEAYLHLVNSEMPAEDARGLLPTNITTKVHYHTNLRALAEHAGMRLCSQAQYEWKQVWAEMIHAILNHSKNDRKNRPAENWQERLICSLFKPVCFSTGKCEFMADTDRYCVIRERVEAHHLAGDPVSEWTDIHPLEPLSEGAARTKRGV